MSAAHVVTLPAVPPDLMRRFRSGSA